MTDYEHGDTVLPNVQYSGTSLWRILPGRIASGRGYVSPYCGTETCLIVQDCGRSKECERCMTGVVVQYEVHTTKGLYVLFTSCDFLRQSIGYLVSFRRASNWDINASIVNKT
jgi:hypothetical protein